VVETIQQNHICHLVMAPADVDDAVRRAVVDQGCRAVEAIDGVGIFGIESFLTDDGSVLMNEMAPRPHNSGHYTIEGCVTSQFENHVRAVMDWPLGSTELRAPAVVMANILGRHDESGMVANYSEVLAHTQAHLHIYGKEHSRKGRKLGHVTALADTIEEAVRRARGMEETVKFGG
jgi:5-(carboxyamino)imidazole ribonucleotide synthase